jgi:hypothetical protein
MLTPEKVERDEDGYWTHSAFNELFGDRECIPKTEWQAWCAHHNIEISITEMESDLDDDDPAWIRHFDEGDAGCVGWMPEPPGDEWHMLTLHDNEDGPVVLWYREVPLADKEKDGA